MKSLVAKCLSPRVIWAVLFLLAGSASVYFLAVSTQAQKNENEFDALARRVKSNLPNLDEPAELINFRQTVGGKITPVIVELNDDPGAVLQFRQSLKIKDSRTAFEKLADYAVELSGKQDQFQAALPERNIRLLMRTVDARQIDGSIRRIEYRFTYLLNGFVAYVANEDLKRLEAQPEVSSVSRIENTRFLLDNAIDYSLGTQMNILDRRFAVFGANQELVPQPIAGHPENPRASALDGFEGQGMNIAVIDSGIDWRHPMFGGTGNSSPLPRVSGQPARSTDNRKVIYYYSMSSPGDPTDDFGHGTLVASNAAGYRVDANTPRITGFFNGVPNADGTPGTGIGPTPGGEYFGTAPQARLMGYKVCGPAPQCPGDTALSMEDAASPYTLLQSGTTAPTPVAKPIADVINLSLGDTAGSAVAASSRAANNAALNGTNVVASAGNAGPGAGTIGAPSAATLAISVAASLDPGSVAGGDLLEADQIAAEPCDGNPTPRPATCEGGAITTAGPPAEYGAASTANTQPIPPFNFKLFPVAGGGAIRQGSVSGHYVYVDASVTPPVIPDSVTNRIAIVKFAGTFASGANPVAAKNPAAIILISATESATAVQVINGIPTFTISVANANILLDRLSDGIVDGDPVPANGAVSLLPIRAAESTSLNAFTPAMASFSSRGPNDHPASNFRQIKPDVTAPGVGIGGAATPDGLPDDTVGLASTTGYTTANGTSFSGPITAGAVTLVRQRVRTQLGLDTTNLNDANYRTKRFDAVTVTRALLQNSATNLRSGLGVPETDPAPSSSVNDVGAGHINIAGALDLKAIMVSPTLLLRDGDSTVTGDQREFNVPTRNAPTLDAQGNLEVLLPTASFGNVAVAGLQTTATRMRKVIVRDVTRGAGGGTYNLTSANNRNVDGVNFAVSFLAANGTTPITSVTVPSGGQATFFVRTAANGATTAPDTEFQWYVYATHAGNGQAMRMPFYYRATAAQVGGAIAAPNQTAPTNVTTPGIGSGCSTDIGGMFNLNWTYAPPAGGPAPVGYRIQQATSVSQLFFDNADNPPSTPANTTFAGSNQWISMVNPTTGSLAYFIADAAMQNESLTMINAVTLPAGGATLTFTSNENTEATYDFANVEISNNGTTWVTLGSFSGIFNGTRQFDLSNYAGGAPIKIRFRFTSDTANDPPPPVGWYVEDIRITSDNFATVQDVAATPTTFALTRTSGSYSYRIAAKFSTTAGDVVGPYSNTRCVNVP